MAAALLYALMVHGAWCLRPEAKQCSSVSADAHSFDYMLVHSQEAKKFDPDGNYVRRWLPVLGRMPAKWIHRCLLTRHCFRAFCIIASQGTFLKTSMVRENALSVFNTH